MIRNLTTLGGAAALAVVLLPAGPSQALTVAVESALICPALEDFSAVAQGQGGPACTRIERHMDLYGPVGRNAHAPGGPFVRVRYDNKFYWAEEDAFYLPSAGQAPAASGKAGLTGRDVPLPPGR